MSGSVLRRGYVPVEPDTSGFDGKLREQFQRSNPGGKAGKQIGGQLNRALRGLDLAPVDVKADPKSAFAAIAATELRLMELSTSAPTVEMKIRSEKALGELGRFRKQLGDVGEESATGFAARFASRVGPLLASAPLSPPILAAIAVAAPAAAALLGGAVAGAAGAGGIIGGVILASKDARVQKASEDLGDTLLAGLRDRAVGFVPPMLDGIGQVRAAWIKIGPDLDRVFEAKRFVGPLVADMLEGGRALVAGFADAVDNADPVMDQFGDSVERIGVAVGSSLSELSTHADEGAVALDGLTDATVGLIQTTTTVVGVLSDVYGAYNAVNGQVERFTNGLGVLEVLDPIRPLKQLWEGLQGVTASADETTEAVRRTGGGTFEMAGQFRIATDDAKVLKEQQQQLKAANDAVTASQDALQRSLDSLGGKTSTAGRNADALRTAMGNLYSATINQTEANEAYEASWDDLSSAVKANGTSLNINSDAGRANRDTLQGLLTKTNESYLADIAAGRAIADATKKHQNRITAIREESRRLGLNKTETQNLINTYGKIPPKKTTDLLIKGVDKIVQALKDLYIYQRSLAMGIPVQSVIALENAKPGPAKRYGGYHDGGYTGEGGEHEPAGVVHRKEFVLRAKATRSIERQQPGLLAEMNATGQLPGYRSGGLVGPVDTSTRWPFTTKASGTKIPSRAQVSAKVVLAPGVFGQWPSSPAAQRGDSGVWRKVLQLIRSGPKQGSFGNAYRPGDPKWHGSGRAVDWMGYNMDALAGFLAARRPLELIHRTRQRDYAYTRGRNKGSFNNSLMEAHRNHIHIAMDDGGFRVLQPGMNLIPNGTGRPELIGGPAAMASVNAASAKEMDRVVDLLQALVRGQERLGVDVADALASNTRRAVRIGRGVGTTTATGAI